MSSSSLQPQHAAFNTAAETISAPIVAPRTDSADCPRCHAPNNNEYHREPEHPNRPNVGDIWGIRETPTTFAHLATGRAGSPPCDLRTPRPAVILGSGPRRAPRGSKNILKTMCHIFLMATFNRESDITKLGSLLRFFCLHVFPHQALSNRLRHPPHVHTSPEWCMQNAWLIAYDFDSSAAINGPWENRDAPSRPYSSYQLDDESLGAVLEACEQKRAEWEQLIERDPKLAKRFFLEYQKKNAEIGRERSASRASSRSASSSRGGHRAVGRRDNMSTLPEVPPIPTIPEGTASAPSASAGDTTSYSPASSTSEGPVTLVPAHGLPSATPRMDPGPSMEDVGTIAGLGNPSQPAEITPVSAA